MHAELTRRKLLQSALTTAAASSLPTAAHPQATLAQTPTGAPRPNILYLHSHDSGRYLSPYGRGTATPTLLKLAQEGVLFRNAFSAAPTCSPSRAALLTGEPAHQAGMFGLVNEGFQLPSYDHHLCHTLHGAAGYHTVLAGLQHIAPRPEMIGFDEILPHKGNNVATVAPAAAAFLASRPQQPFFMDCGFFETHRRFGPGRDLGYPDETPRDDPRFAEVPLTLPDNEETRRDIAGFHTDARTLDSGVAMVLAALEKAGLADNTIVISTTDHGIAFPQMKCNLYDPGWAVSLILRGPGPFRGGKVVDALTSQIDLFPTLCDYLQIAKPQWLRGQSLLPVLTGQTLEVNQAVFAEVNYHVAYEPKRAVRTQRYKYIKRYDGRTTDVIDNCDDGRSKRFLDSQGWQAQHLVAAEELYDLVFDPTERNNLAPDPAHAATLTEMRARLQAWQQATADPILRGPIPLPPGARAEDPNQIGKDHS